MGQPARINPFDPEAVAKMVGGTRGRRHFEDSLGTCIFTTRSSLANICRILSAATGWEFTKDDAIRFGRRTATLMRAFNLRCGITPDLEKPSKRYGSIPVDGPAKGQDIGARTEMVQAWYETVGYDPETGKPWPRPYRRWGWTSSFRHSGAEECAWLHLKDLQPPPTGQVAIEVVAWITKFVGGDGSTRKVFHEALRDGDTVRTVLRRLSGRFPQLHKALWDPETEISPSILKCWSMTRCSTSPIRWTARCRRGDGLALIGQYLGG